MAETETFPAKPSIARQSGLLRRLFASQRAIAVGYMVFLILAEAITTLLEPRVGMVAHGLLLLMLFLHASLWDHGRLRGFLLSLSMAPLIRLLSLSLPLPSFPFIYWYMVVGAPLLIAALVAAQIGRINRRMLGLTMRNLPVQLLIATSGVILGYLEYRILRPDPLISELRLDLLWVPALILLIFTGFLEEWVFRGLMQYTAMRSFGRFGFYYVAVVFAVLHLGYKSALDVVFVFVVALFFGWAAQKSGSILGVTLSHGLTNIGLFLVFPFIAVNLPSLPPMLPVQNPVVETQPAPSPGLLAPLSTMEATRPWVPPTATARPTQSATPAVTRTATATNESNLPAVTETLPSPQASPTCAPRRDWVPYVVQPGDTLFYIAQQTGITIEQLLQANCSNSFTIYSGQVLYVPFRLRTPVPLPSATGTLIPTDTPEPLPSALPTDTSEPTSTPTPTDTPLPTETQTETPTDIPTEIPTDTPTIAPTETSVPTDTPVP